MNLMHVGRPPLRSYLTAGMGATRRGIACTRSERIHNATFWRWGASHGAAQQLLLGSISPIQFHSSYKIGGIFFFFCCNHVCSNQHPLQILSTCVVMSWATLCNDCFIKLMRRKWNFHPIWFMVKIIIGEIGCPEVILTSLQHGFTVISGACCWFTVIDCPVDPFTNMD